MMDKAGTPPKSPAKGLGKLVLWLLGIFFSQKSTRLEIFEDLLIHLLFNGSLKLEAVHVRITVLQCRAVIKDILGQGIRDQRAVQQAELELDPDRYFHTLKAEVEKVMEYFFFGHP